MSATADDLIHTSSEPHADSGHQRSLSGLAQRTVMAAALAFSAYQLVVAAFHPL